MSLQVLGPRPYFWQWDTGKQLVVNNADCGEVHFCNGTSDCALVVAIKTAEDGTRVVDVPDILLQTAKPIRAYLFQRNDAGAETTALYRFEVIARNRPENYVYTEPERLTWAALDERITALEQGGGGGGGLSVTDDGDGNVIITSSGSVSITDDSNGNVIIA